MDAFRQSRQSGPPIEADMCRACDGIWYDASEVAAAHRSLGELSFQPPGVFSTPRAPIQCPRCNVAMATVPFFAITLDYCRRCHGVWVDGGEHAALAAARTREPSQDLAAPYRSGAASAMFRGVVTCKRCQREVATSDTLVTGDGLMCVTCATEWESLPPEARDAEHAESLRRIGIEEDRVPRSSEAWSFVRDTGRAIGTLLGAITQPYCSRCGRPRANCGH